MLNVHQGAYDALLGNIDQSTIDNAKARISQCTGCMCNCRCSCSGGLVSEFEWEVI